MTRESEAQVESQSFQPTTNPGYAHRNFGGIVTKERYTDYRLVVEYRWGPVTWKPRADKTRDSGILLHCQGTDGNYRPDFKSPWLRSVEYEIMEGSTGAVRWETRTADYRDGEGHAHPPLIADGKLFIGMSGGDFAARSASFRGKYVSMGVEASLHAHRAQLPQFSLPQQFDNPANPDIHEKTTGPEIW